MKSRFPFVIICSIFVLSSCNSPSTPTSAVSEALVGTPISTATPADVPMSTNTPVPTDTPAPTKTPIPHETSTATLTAVANTPTPVQHATTPTSDSQSMGTPVPSWQGLPIMPKAIEGRPAGFSYVYSADSPLEDAEAYYLDHMEADGWRLTSRQSNEKGLLGPTVVLMFARGEEIAQVILVFSAAENYTMVTLTLVPATSTPIPTSVPLLDLSGVVLTLQDLPAGFEKVPLAEIGLSEEELYETMEIENSFVFRISTPDYLETIKGFVTSLPARMRESNDEDRLSTQTNILVDSIASGYIGSSETEIEVLSVPDSIGDVVAGRTFITPLETPGLEEYAVRTEIMVFQRNTATVILVVEYVDGFTPAITLTDTAQILDKRILEMLRASN
jgi:hypothetical protein